MTQKGMKQDCLKKNSTKNIFNIASKKLTFNNPFLANKTCNKHSEDAKHTRFISLSKPEKIHVVKNLEDTTEMNDSMSKSSSIVQLRISPRHPNNNNNNNYNNVNKNKNNNNNCIDPNSNNSINMNRDNNVNNNSNNNNKSNNKIIIDTFTKDPSNKNTFNSLVTKINDNNYTTNNKNNEDNFTKKTSGLNNQNNKNNDEYNTNQSKNYNFSVNNNMNSTNNNSNSQTTNTNNTTNKPISTHNHLKSPLATTKGYSNDIIQFLRQETDDFIPPIRTSPPRIYPISGRLSLNKSIEIIKPIAFRPQTASLLKERRGSRNNDSTANNYNTPNNKSRLSNDTYNRRITTSHLTQQKSFSQPQHVQQNSFQNVQLNQQHIQQKPIPQHPHLLQPIQPPLSNNYDDGYNSQNLSSSSTTSTSSSSSSQCLPEDHSTAIPCKRAQSSRGHKKIAQDSKSRQSVHSFQKSQPGTVFQDDSVSHSKQQEILIFKSLSGNDVVVDSINSIKSVKTYKMMMSNKDKEISWLKNQLKKRDGSFDDQTDEAFPQNLPWKAQSAYTEEDLMLRILELKKENQILNYQLETLETNLNEAYREKDEATRLLETMKKQLEKTHSETSEKLNEICSVRREDGLVHGSIRGAPRSSYQFKKNCTEHSIQADLSNNNLFNDPNNNGNYNKSTSSKLAGVIEKMEELERKREEDRQRWQEEKQVVVEYQRKLQERLMESSEGRWRLEKELNGLKIKLEQRRASDRIKSLGVESYC